MTPRLLSLLTITLARIGLFYKSQQVHYYTRERKTGDQVMLRGNRAIAEHQADGTALRLFVAVGNRPGSGTRIHQYVGQFAVDPQRPYVVRRAPGC